MWDKRGGGALTALYPSDTTASLGRLGHVLPKCHSCIFVSRLNLMSDMPWFRFFPSDWLGGTRGLTASEAGVYITLVALMYEREGYIDANHARLSRLCGASNSAFKKAIETLLEDGKITLSDGKYTQERVLKELSYRLEKQTVAEKAAKTRWDKNSTKSKDEVQRTHSEGNAIPEARNQNKEIDTNVSTKKNTPRSVLESILDQDHAEAALDHRKRLRKPMSVRAAEMMVKNLKECDDPNAAVDLMIERGWQSVNPEWVRNASQSLPSRASQNRRETAADVLFDLAKEMENAERGEPDRQAIGFVPAIEYSRS